MTRTSLLKRFGAFLLALMMCVSLFPVSAFAEGEETTEPPHEHSWTDWTVTKAATCTEAGEQLHTCTACGASGTEPVLRADYNVVEFKDDAKVILCTDGMSNYITDDSLLDFIRNNSCSELTDKLIEKSKQLGGSDNITVAVISAD